MGLGHSLVDVTESDDELLDRARGGDRGAFEALYRRHREAARRVAAVLSDSRADAEDAVAEGFARLFAALPRLAGRDIVFRAYLLTTVRNVATDRHRRMRKVDLREAVPEWPSEPEADQSALSAAERHLVREALQTLPSRWRTVLWLTAVEGLTPTEVGRLIGITPAAVAALAYRSRQGLRSAYRELDQADSTTRATPLGLTAAA
ncbi:MAG: sigma-70 family RNA polymerase sigma factor [Actinomycetota bacterium]|nr:sigma-70 family RNA polymerase sigma factor [Actinomycetota bacterium]